MAATLTIRDDGTLLTLQVRETRSYGRLALTLLIGGVFLYFFARDRSESAVLYLLFVGLIAFSLLTEIVSQFRGTDVTLHAGKLDFCSEGHAPGGYKPAMLSRADIFSLEYRDAAGGGDFPEYPQGLYADHGDERDWNTGSCLLPHLDEAQVKEAIAAILLRFPETRTFENSLRSLESGLVLLNLNRP